MRTRWAAVLLAVGLALGGVACDTVDDDVDVVEDETPGRDAGG